MKRVDLLVDRSLRGVVPASLVRALARTADRLARVAAGVDARVEVRLCDDTAIAELNALHLGHAGPTDVLSFPAAPGFGHAPVEEGLGSIVLSWPTLVRQSPQRGPAGWHHEARSLLVHGVAHLLGHDHGRAAQARRMLACEHRLARAVGIAIVRPYATAAGVRG
jgi:probable rRNA maturation factor